MRRLAILTMVAGLMLAGTAAADPPRLASSHRGEPESLTTGLVQRLQEVYTTKQLEDGVYVGDELCIACHQWAAITRDAKHRKALRAPYGANSLIAGKGVVADYDQNGVDDFMQGLDFNQISSVFDPYKPNAPVLSYDAATDTYWMQIGALKMQVWITQGGTGDWKQRYLLKVPVTGTATGEAGDNYISPMQYNEKTHEYVLYHPEHWWNADGSPVVTSAAPPVTELAAVGRSYSKKCIGCHTTGVRELFQDANNEWIYRPWPAILVNPVTREQYPDYDRDGTPDQVNIGCEACHGPGSAHVLQGGGPGGILAPSGLDTDEANRICEQCHVRVKSVPNGTHDWPYRDDVGEPWIPGHSEVPLEDFYTDAAGLWPDGVTSRQHHQQWRDFQESEKPGFPFHPVKCVECHSPHSSAGEHMTRTRLEQDGLTIATDVHNNTLCLACHATHGSFEEISKEQVAEYEANLDHIENVVSAHTNHPYAPERSMGLSRCTGCHMPKAAKSAINYDIHAHTFEAIAPEKTLMYQEAGGMPNSCAVSCHSLKVNSFGLGLDPDIGSWNEGFDVMTAEYLKIWFGPGGLWWNTEHEESITKRVLEGAAAPGEIAPTSREQLQD